MLTEPTLSTAPALPRRPGLSKSRIAIFEQCAKRLWLSAYKPELSDESDNTKRSFQVGHDVGAVAFALYPDGLMIDATSGLTAAAEATRAAIEAVERRPLFEATFIHENVVVRVDLLLPDGDGWHVVEVKSTTRVKPYQRADLATQLWVMQGCGVPVSRASIRVIDTSFVLHEEGNYHGLFIDEPADVVVAQLVELRADTVAAANATLDGLEPIIPIGAHCTDPFSCSFDSYCRRHLPEPPQWPTSLLPGIAGKAVARALEARGITDLLLVDAADIAQPQLQRIHASTLSGFAHHDAAAVAAETRTWAYPRTFLDFETIAFAIPRWVGTSPYQQVPFQFSAHIDRGEGQLEHAEFLSLDSTDPREACARALTSLPETGAVIAWNASFERSCLLKLASSVPDYAHALQSLASRLIDLLPVARRHYYHRDMRGSWSIKAVLPTLAPELNYKLLDGARSGAEAQDAYLEVTHRDTTPQRREAIRAGLLDYCRLDTMAMVIALERLCEVAAI